MDTNRVITWNDGQFAGDLQLVGSARDITCEDSTPWVAGEFRPCNNHTPAGALTAMILACRERARVLTDLSDLDLPGWNSPLPKGT